MKGSTVNPVVADNELNGVGHEVAEEEERGVVYSSNTTQWESAYLLHSRKYCNQPAQL
jgi:hypothetical protein